MNPQLRTSSPVASIQAEERRARFRLLERKEKWALTGRAWLLLFCTLVALWTTLFFGVQPFLSTTQREEADILVVEGWAHQFAIRASVEEFHKGAYKHVVTTGGPVVGNGGYVNDYQTSASVGADLLTNAGLAKEYV